MAFSTNPFSQDDDENKDDATGLNPPAAGPNAQPMSAALQQDREQQQASPFQGTGITQRGPTLFNYLTANKDANTTLQAQHAVENTGTKSDYGTYGRGQGLLDASFINRFGTGDYKAPQIGEKFTSGANRGQAATEDEVRQGQANLLYDRFIAGNNLYGQSSQPNADYGAIRNNINNAAPDTSGYVNTLTDFQRNAQIHGREDTLNKGLKENSLGALIDLMMGTAGSNRRGDEEIAEFRKGNEEKVKDAVKDARARALGTVNQRETDNNTWNSLNDKLDSLQWGLATAKDDIEREYFRNQIRETEGAINGLKERGIEWGTRTGDAADTKTTRVRDIQNMLGQGMTADAIIKRGFTREQVRAVQKNDQTAMDVLFREENFRKGTRK